MKTRAIVIGSGPGGYHCAIRLRQRGVETVVVERDIIGGTCLNRGCIPAKALLTASEVAESLPFWKKAGLRVEYQGVDLPSLQSWKRGIVERLDRGIAFLFKNNGVQYLEGEARLRDAHTVEVRTPEGIKTVEAEYIVIATGSKPVELKGFPVDGERIVVSDQALEWEEVPKSLLVVGAGAVGLELGAVYQRFGSQVTVVEMMPQILPGMDAESAHLLTRSLIRKGMQIHTGMVLADLERRGAGFEALLRATEGVREERVQVTHVLIAVGRRPVLPEGATELLSPDERGYLQPDAHQRTRIPHIFAIGDCARPPLLAHKAFMEGLVAAHNIAGEESTYEPQAVPAVIYTDPERASVGKTEEELKKEGTPYQVGKFP